MSLRNGMTGGIGNFCGLCHPNFAFTSNPSPNPNPNVQKF